MAFCLRSRMRLSLLVLGSGLVLILFLSPFRFVLLAGIHQNLFALYVVDAVATGQDQSLQLAEHHALQTNRRTDSYAGSMAYRLALAYDSFGLQEEAFLSYLSAVQSGSMHDSMMADALLKLATYYRDQDRLSEAIEALQRISELSTSSVNAKTLAYARVYLGEIQLVQTQDRSIYQSYLEEALNLYVDGGILDRYLSLNLRYIEEGTPSALEQALNIGVRATEIQPNNTWTALARCRAHLARQELTDANVWCSRARGLSSRNHHARVWLGVVYARQEQWQDAYTEFQAAVDLSPDNDWYRQWLARAQEQVEQRTN